MQRLNDLYTKEKAQFVELNWLSASNLEEIKRLKLEVDSLTSEKNKVEVMKNVNVELNALVKRTQEEKMDLERVVKSLEGNLRELEQKNSQMNSHCWNIADELKEAKSSLAEEILIREVFEPLIYTLAFLCHSFNVLPYIK
jgi:predicted  nucleic acid-binding Zn-ribbon protein